MFYSSDPVTKPSNYLSLDRDKYSSIRVLDQTHQKLRHSVSETNIFGRFSSEQREANKSVRPCSTIGFDCGHFEVSNGEPKDNYSNSTGDIDRGVDPFADILEKAKLSFQKTTDERDTQVSVNCPHESQTQRGKISVGDDPAETRLDCSARVDTPAGRVASPRYHTLNEDELDEELLEENETRSRNDSVVLRHEILRSCSTTETSSTQRLVEKSNGESPYKEALGVGVSDVRKGYVQLRFDATGIQEEEEDEKEVVTSDVGTPRDSQDNVDGRGDQCGMVREPKSFNFNWDHPEAQDRSLKCFTVDVGELHRQSANVSRPRQERRAFPRVISPSCGVSTTFSTSQKTKTECRSPERKSESGHKPPLSPGFVFFGDGLFDITEERNEEAVAFSVMVGDLRREFSGKQHLNLGYLLSPTVTRNSTNFSEYFEEVTLSLEVFLEGRDSPIAFDCGSRSRVNDVIKKVIEIVSKQEVTPSSAIEDAYVVQVCSFQEFLSPSKMLCEYERVHDCVMARKSVRLALLDSDRIPRSLVRSDRDDVVDGEPRIYSQFFERPLDTSVSRQGLTVLREAFDEELRRVLRDADDAFEPRLQPGRLIQSVRAVCTTLGQIETKGITNAVYDIKEMKRNYDIEYNASSSIYVKVDLMELRSILQSLYKHVYLLIELYCNTFNTDFGKIRISERPAFGGSVEVTSMTDKFKLYLPAAYRIPPDWKEKFEGFYVEGKIYYGGQALCVSEDSVITNISTNFLPQITLQCWMEFPIEVRKLPRESKLCLTLYGLPQANKSSTLSVVGTPLGWTSIQLFDFNGLLASGSHLFGLWPNQAANPLGACMSNLTDKRSAILHVDFDLYLAEILFPALSIPCVTLANKESSTCSAETFSKLLNKDMFEELRPDEVNMIWSNRHCAIELPWMLPLVLSSVPDWTYQNLPDIYQLLACWTPMSPVVAMELLKVQFPDQMVRATAVRWMECFSDDELCDYLPQLAQSLKYESYHNSPLARFLIERALGSSRLAHYLFWHLKVNIGDPQFGQRYQVILGGLLSTCGSLQRDQFTIQDELVTRVTEIAEKVKKSKENARAEILRSELVDIPNETIHQLRLPLNPGVEVEGFVIDDCSYFNSNSVPLRLIYKNSDDHGFSIDTIYKVGDDLRQDALTMQLIGIMNKLWLEEGLDLKMVTYRCLPTGEEMGMVEVVEDAQTLRQIQTEYGLVGSFKDEPLARWLLKHNPIEKEYGEAVNNFIASCAGYCVATYVIGICDRHNDNIMVKKTGHLFHIDFSKFLGRSQMFGSFRRDRSPFVLTSDMAYVINGGCTPTSRFQDFVDLCCKAFNIIRHHTNLFLNLLSLMLNSGIPYLSETSDIKYVYDVLLPQATDSEATTIFTRQIESSLASKFTQVNFFIHNVAQKRTSAVQVKEDETTNPVLSFSPHNHTVAKDGRIVSARVVDYQKLYTPEKYYVYLINVCREDHKEPTFVFRRYSYFHEFNAKLTDQFPHRSLPRLPGKIYLGRSQIRMVAEKRRQDFDSYLQVVLSMDEVCTSELVYTFLHSRPADEMDVKKYFIRPLPEEKDTHDRPIGGEVKVSISFSSDHLNIMVMHAKNLLPKSAGSLSDPYVKIYLTPDPTKSTKRKTKIARRSLNPTYNERFEWEITESELRKRQIRVTVWDYDVLTENELMGGVVIEPSDYDFSNHFTGWFTLTDLKTV